MSFLGDRPAVIYALHAARGPTLIFNGLGDSVVGIPGRRVTILLAQIVPRRSLRFVEKRLAFGAEVIVNYV